MALSKNLSAVCLAGLLVVPIVWDSFTAYQLGLFLLYGIVGQGVALCWGRAGFLPLGQALYFGLGAYIFGAFLKTYDGQWLVLVPSFVLACLVPALLATIIGLLVFKRQIGSGPYFSLITLALAMLGFQLANSMVSLTGGFNGMTGIPGLPGIDTYENLYFVIVAALAVTTAYLFFLDGLPFGQLMLAVSQNEERLQFLGFNTANLKAVAFGVSAGMAGLAGALFAPHQGIVTPQSVGFLLSAEFVIWTAVGGRSSIAGPVIGAIVIGFLASELRDVFRYWEVVIGLVFVIVVLKFPDGIIGLFHKTADRFVPTKPAKHASRTVTGTRRKQHREVAIRFDNVGLVFGPVRVLDDLSFDITQPGIHALIGPNGAGKTSAYNVLTGKYKTSSGSITFANKSLNGLQPYQVANLGIARKFQVPSVFPDLTINQNIDIALWSGKISWLELFSKKSFRANSPLLSTLAERFPFMNEGNKRAGSLSLGQRQMLDFSMTYLTDAPLVLLDEPCAGLSTAETKQMIDAISAINAETGSTSIIIEHDMQVVEHLSDHVLVMHNGALLASGSIDEIRANKAVQNVYSGGTK